MFKFIKNLFGDTHTSAPVSKSSSAATLEVEKSPPLPSFQPPPVRPPAPAGPNLELPLDLIAQRMAPSLRCRLTRPVSQSDMVQLPMSIALEQLPRGAVRIPFRDLRQGAPGLFHSAPDLDETLVDLPIAEVLSRIQPKSLTRKPDQKRLPVPDGIPLVFASQHAPRPAAAAPAPPSPVRPPAEQDDLSSSRIIAQHTLGATAPTRKAATPSAPPAPIRPTPSVPLPAPLRAAPVEVPQPAPNSSAAAIAPTSGSEPLKVPIVSLARNWPEPMRREVLATHLSASINLPPAELEAAMKRGRAVFTWKQLRLWMHPKPSSALAEHDAVSLELPLSVLTPLFLARRGTALNPKKQLSVDEIPDVFQARKPAEVRSAPALETSEALEGQPAGRGPEVPPATPAAPSAAKAQSVPSTGAVTAPDKLTLARSSPLPTELVQRACHLSGVTGALIATPDGLVIASQLPSSMNAEMAAGFLPQVYSRLGQYTRELKLGDPSQVEMLVGKIPLQIFKCPQAYFAVLGKAAEPLPKLQLSALAGQLSARTN